MTNPEPTITTHIVRVDGRMLFDDMIAVGHFSYVHGSITQENFPLEVHDPRSVELHIVHFNHEMTNEEVLPALANLGLRPGDLRELCALVITFPDLREIPITARGSMYWDQHGRGMCPSSYSTSASRLELRTCIPDEKITYDARFLAASK